MAQQDVTVHCAADHEVFQMKKRWEEIPSLFLRATLLLPKSPGQISTDLLVNFKSPGIFKFPSAHILTNVLMYLHAFLFHHKIVCNFIIYKDSWMTYKSINLPTKEHVTNIICYHTDKTNSLNISERKQLNHTTFQSVSFRF